MATQSLSATELTDKSRGVIPFTVVDGLIVLKMEVDGIEGNYILDSGAESIIINRPALRPDAIFTTVHGERSGEKGRAPIKLAGAEEEFMEVWYVDLTDVTAKLSSPIHGLIGATLLERQDIMIDYDLERIVLLDKVDHRLEVSATRRVVTLPFDIHYDNMPIIHSKIDGRIVRLGFDTGANTTVLHRSLATKDNVDVVLDGILLKSINHIKEDLSDLVDARGKSIDGILSASALDANQIIISYRQRKIHIIIDQAFTAN